MKQENQFILMNRNEFFSYIMSLPVQRNITHIQNHHTADPSYKNFNGCNHIELMKSMKAYHINECGFSDIAQHFSTFSDGLICVGRSLELDPAGIHRHNMGGICLEHVINADMGGDNMTNEHKTTIIFINAVLCLKFNLPINTDTIVYHNWFAYLSNLNIKTCPGTNFIGGNTKSSAQNCFYPLIFNEINRIKNPPPIQPQIPQWQYEAAEWLHQNNFTNNSHSPLEQVSFGLFGFIMNNKFDKLPNCEPISYLIQHNWIKQSHLPQEPLTINTLGFILANRFGDVVTTNPVDYMLKKGLLNNPRNPDEIITFGLLGAILKNGQMKGINL